MTNRFGNGAGSVVLPASGEFWACCANDNESRALTFAAPHGACGFVLARDANQPGASLSALLQDGTMLCLHHVTQSHDVIALWRGLGRDFNLPLYLQDAQESLICVSYQPGDLSFTRRLGSPLSGRRPRFLSKRKTALKPFSSPKALKKRRS